MKPAFPDPELLQQINVPQCRRLLKYADAELKKHIASRTTVASLLRMRANFMDRLLRRVWREHISERRAAISLIAGGGYGRRELYPHSDVDLLLLLRDAEAKEQYSAQIERFIAFLWELHIHPGHSVRTLEECEQLAAEEISVTTNLMEARRISGSALLLRQMQARIHTDKIWSSKDFFAAKLQERSRRMRRYADAIYNLEPDVKQSPGGLRDLHLIGWITQRHFGVRRMRILIESGLLTEAEFGTLCSGRIFMQRLRFHLHLLKERNGDRLDFETQRTLSVQYGYRDTHGSLAVEKFMRRYYRWALRITELFSTLEQNFHEQILWGCAPLHSRALNPRFRICNGHIEASRPNVFQQTPSALLEIFVLLANHPSIVGIRANTQRLLRENCKLIDHDFRNDPRNTQLFMELLRSPHQVAQQLFRMRRCGILEAWLPEFKRISGLLQYDLFHIYPVDEHTIQLILNIRRFNRPQQRQRFPIAAAIVRRLQKIELLYIAALYHDIAKGRGGDHSQLGEQDVIRFCQRHQLAEADTELVAWLVRHHLLMSMTAQRRDISDPVVIREFARKIGNRQQLDYLYALTVADICATNPSLWNAWRDTLLRDLYLQTRRFLLHNSEQFQQRTDWIATARQRALDILQRQKIQRQPIEALWNEIGEDYFLREKAGDIAWHTAGILTHKNSAAPLIMIRSSSESICGDIIQIFIHTNDYPCLFSDLSRMLERMQLNVQDAHLFFNKSGRSLHSFFVLRQGDNSMRAAPEELEQIRQTLLHKLCHPAEKSAPVRRIIPERLGKFSTLTTATFEQEAGGDYSILEVVTADRPGVLVRIARVLEQFQLQLHGARITTLGERVDDVFYLSNHDHRPILDPVQHQLIQDSICGELLKSTATSPAQRAASEC